MKRSISKKRQWTKWTTILGACLIGAGAITAIIVPIYNTRPTQKSNFSDRMVGWPAPVDPSIPPFTPLPEDMNTATTKINLSNNNTNWSAGGWEDFPGTIDTSFVAGAVSVDYFQPNVDNMFKYDYEENDPISILQYNKLYSFDTLQKLQDATNLDLYIDIKATGFQFKAKGSGSGAIDKSWSNTDTLEIDDVQNTKAHPIDVHDKTWSGSSELGAFYCWDHYIYTKYDMKIWFDWTKFGIGWHKVNGVNVGYLGYLDKDAYITWDISEQKHDAKQSHSFKLDTQNTPFVEVSTSADKIAYNDASNVTAIISSNITNGTKPPVLRAKSDMCDLGVDYDFVDRGDGTGVFTMLKPVTGKSSRPVYVVAEYEETSDIAYVLINLAPNDMEVDLVQAFSKEPIIQMLDEGHSKNVDNATLKDWFKNSANHPKINYDMLSFDIDTTNKIFTITGMPKSPYIGSYAGHYAPFKNGGYNIADMFLSKNIVLGVDEDPDSPNFNKDCIIPALKKSGIVAVSLEDTTFWDHIHATPWAPTHNITVDYTANQESHKWNGVIKLSYTVSKTTMKDVFKGNEQLFSGQAVGQFENGNELLSAIADWFASQMPDITFYNNEATAVISKQTSHLVGAGVSHMQATISAKQDSNHYTSQVTVLYDCYLY